MVEADEEEEEARCFWIQARHVLIPLDPQTICLLLGSTSKTVLPEQVFFALGQFLPQSVWSVVKHFTRTTADLQDADTPC